MDALKNSRALFLVSSVARAALGVLALTVSLVACSDDDGAAGDATAAAGSELDGTWETACYQKTRTSLRYDHLSFVGTFSEYSDDACSTPYHVSTWTGTAAVTGATAAGDRKIDLTFATFRSVALTEENAAFNNQNAYCGLTDWQANVERDVLGQACYGFAIPAGGKSLDLYRVDGATLKFGQGATISATPTEADRPATIDETRVFTKK